LDLLDIVSRRTSPIGNNLVIVDRYTHKRHTRRNRHHNHNNKNYNVSTEITTFAATYIPRAAANCQAPNETIE
jgi:hypothetical protein